MPDPDSTSERQEQLSPAKRALLEKWKRGQLAGASPPASAPPVPGAPLSFAQQRLWFLDQLAPGSAAYNVPLGVHLAGRLHVPALARSLDTIVERHGTLRTTFAVVSGLPVQRVAPPSAMGLPVVDLADLPEPERRLEVERLMAGEAQQPFDLASRPPIRARLLRLAETDHVLLITMHHITTDNLSYTIFIRELVSVYRAYSAGRPSPLAELPMQYVDYAAWQRQWLESGGRMEAQLSYWKQQLAGARAALHLPTDRPRPAVQTFRGALRPVALSARLLDPVHALAQAEGAALFMPLLAAFAVLLHQLSGQTDIAVGVPVPNRPRAELEALIGFFANTVVLRLDLSGTPSFRDLVRQARRVTEEAHANQDVPFEKLVEELQLGRDLSRNPLFQVMFSLDTAPPVDFDLPGLSLALMNRPTASAKFDLHLTLGVSPSGLGGRLEYNTDLFDDHTIGRTIDRFLTLLQRMADRPDSPIGQWTV